METTSYYDLYRQKQDLEDEEFDFNDFWETGLLVFIGRLPANYPLALIGNGGIGQAHYVLTRHKTKQAKKQQTMIMKMIYIPENTEH